MGLITSLDMYDLNTLWKEIEKEFSDMQYTDYAFRGFTDTLPENVKRVPSTTDLLESKYVDPTGSPIYYPIPYTSCFIIVDCIYWWR